MSADEPRDEEIIIRVPDELPILSRSAYRTLLDILIELTEVPVLDEPRERGSE